MSANGEEIEARFLKAGRQLAALCNQSSSGMVDRPRAGASIETLDDGRKALLFDSIVYNAGNINRTPPRIASFVGYETVDVSDVDGGLFRSEVRNYRREIVPYLTAKTSGSGIVIDDADGNYNDPTFLEKSIQVAKLVGIGALVEIYLDPRPGQDYRVGRISDNIRNRFEQSPTTSVMFSQVDLRGQSMRDITEEILARIPVQLTNMKDMATSVRRANTDSWIEGMGQRFSPQIAAAMNTVVDLQAGNFVAQWPESRPQDYSEDAREKATNILCEMQIVVLENNREAILDAVAPTADSERIDPGSEDDLALE